jgi:hypothetical protein
VYEHITGLLAQNPQMTDMAFGISFQVIIKHNEKPVIVHEQITNFPGTSAA